MRSHILTLCVAIAVNSAIASQTIYTYSQTDELYQWGLKVAQTYNVAIELGSAFKDNQVKTVSVPVTVTPNINTYQIWLTSALDIDNVDGKKVNHTDILCEEVTPTDIDEALKTGVITYTLPEGYTIPESGVYVGYSFTVSAISSDYDRYPVLVTQPGVENGFYVYTSKTYRQWKERSLEINATSPIKVTLEGDFASDAVLLGNLGDLAIQSGEVSQRAVTVYNVGSQPVESVGYVLEVAGTTYAGQYVFDTPIPSVYNYAAEASIQVPALEIGLYDYKLTISEVNGKPNGKPASTSGVFNAVEALPLKRPLMEEFTGTWCQWCPRGFVAMEKMSELHPDFVSIAYHSGDKMEMPNYPHMEDGYPTAFLDRQISCDPYYGTSETPFGIEALWLNMSKETAPVEITLEADGVSKEGFITVTSDVFWAMAPSEGEYRVEYVLVGDGICQATWTQSNAYSRYQQGEAGPYMDPFCKGGKYGYSSVPGLVFNDVALLCSGGKGVEGSIANVATGVHSTHTYEFDLSQTTLSPLVKNYRVVAMVLRADSAYGKVLNSNKAEVKTLDAITSVATDAAVESVTYCDLYGRRIDNPTNGLYIKTIRYTDGTVRTLKVAKSF